MAGFRDRVAALSQSPTVSLLATAFVLWRLIANLVGGHWWFVVFAVCLLPSLLVHDRRVLAERRSR